VNKTKIINPSPGTGQGRIAVINVMISGEIVRKTGIFID